MHQGTKSQLIPILEDLITETTENEPHANAIIIDGASRINACRPSTGTTFYAYGMEEIIPRIEKYATEYIETHLVFDIYMKDSLKSQTRQKRGRGARRKVVDTTKTPSNWASFLRVDANKTELFGYLAKKLASALTNNVIFITKGDSVLCTTTQDKLAELQGCTHEEADMRMFLHAAYSARHGATAAIIVSSDADVVVIAVSLMQLSPNHVKN